MGTMRSVGFFTPGGLFVRTHVAAGLNDVKEPEANVTSASRATEPVAWVVLGAIALAMAGVGFALGRATAR